MAVAVSQERGTVRSGFEAGFEPRDCPLLDGQEPSKQVPDWLLNGFGQPQFRQVLTAERVGSDFPPRLKMLAVPNEGLTAYDTALHWEIQ